jgi:proline reductase-associated electron transfer protein PrdC
MQKNYQLLLKQHIGVPSVPVVKAGDVVKKGTLIGQCPKGALGVNLHASVAGQIKNVTDDYIEITADEIQTDDYESIEGNSVIELIEAAGIVGMGGAGFPTHVKLKTKFGAPPTVIINAAECEPVLQHNTRSIEADPAKIYRGLLYAMESVNSPKGLIAIKAKHTEAIKRLEEVISDSKVSIALLPDLYPIGEERAVIRETLGILLEVNQLPSEANALVINSETAASITDAVELKKPLITKNITLGGRIHDTKLIQTFFEVPLGTTAETLLNKASGGSGSLEYGEMIMGGPFTGKSCTKETPITKTSGGLILTMPFIKDQRKMGLLVCACGANKERLEEIAGQMGAKVVGIEYCKQAVEVRGALKCENPGKCPGQTQKVLKLKKEGAETLLISNCTDCTNTVMSIAPQLKMPVYHCTDGALRAVNQKLIRKVKI